MNKEETLPEYLTSELEDCFDQLCVQETYEINDAARLELHRRINKSSTKLDDMGYEVKISVVKIDDIVMDAKK